MEHFLVRSWPLHADNDPVPLVSVISGQISTTCQYLSSSSQAITATTDAAVVVRNVTLSVACSLFLFVMSFASQYLC